MHSEIRGGVLDRCRCCFEEGIRLHDFELVHVKMFKNYLNLILTWDSSVKQVICSDCVGFLQEAQKFRKVVISSQRRLLRLHSATVCNDSKEATTQGHTSENSTVKIEVEISNKAMHRVHDDLHTDVADRKDGSTAEIDGNTEFKTEMESSPEYVPDWDRFEDIKFDVKDEIGNMKTPKVERKRKKNAKIHDKKCDSDSDTPLSQIINKKSRLKKKIKKETKSLTSSSKESRKRSFLDNKKVRSNIILILQHSTILPFKNNFKCFYCDNPCILFKELKQHVEAEHNNVSETAIAKVVGSLQNLMVTADISHIKCKLCEEEFKSIENLVEHLCNTHKMTYHKTDKNPSHGILGVDLSTDTFKCHICYKDFTFFKNLSSHMNEHYGSIVCSVCGKKFLSKHRHKSHVFRAHADKKTKCKYCGMIFNTEPALAYHVRKEHIKPVFKCPKCPEKFVFGQYVKRLNHMAEAHGIQKPIFKCDTCGRKYANSASLAAHKQYTHKRTKEHKCEICGYVTVYNTVMKKHMDVHNGVKNYECEFCMRKFTKLNTLRVHLKIHLNDKRFICSLCDAAFIQKNGLKSHLKSRHPDSGIDISNL